MLTYHIPVHRSQKRVSGSGNANELVRNRDWIWIPPVIFGVLDFFGSDGNEEQHNDGKWAGGE